MKDVEVRDEVVEVSKRLYFRGLVAGAGGNVSAINREKERVFITPSGLCKGYLKPMDVVEVDYSGRVISGGLKPTSELSMHLNIYRVRGDVGAVVHAHPPISTGFACASIPLNHTLYPEVIAMIGRVPLVKYVTPTTRELAKEVERQIPGVNALLLESHGTITVGSTLEQAYQRTELLEDFAKISLVSKLLGGGRHLPRREVEKIVNLDSEKYRLKLVKKKKNLDEFKARSY